MFNHIAPPSKLPVSAEYHVFREGIKPDWDDENNKGGGRWVVQCGKDKVDGIWKLAVLAAIGEVLESSDNGRNLVCGLTCNVKYDVHKIYLWTSISKEKEQTEALGRIFKENLDFLGEISFLPHDNSNPLNPTFVV